MKELSIPKNHNQRMYKFGYDEGYNQAVKESIKQFKKRVNYLESHEGSRCVEGSILFDIKTWNKFKKGIR